MDSSDEKPTPKEAPRRRYERPRIEESGGFERLVLTCGFLPGGSGACNPRGRPPGVPSSG